MATHLGHLLDMMPARVLDGRHDASVIAGAAPQQCIESSDYHGLVVVFRVRQSENGLAHAAIGRAETCLREGTDA